MNIEGDLSLQLRNADRFVKESLNISRSLHQDLLATRQVEVSIRPAAAYLAPGVCRTQAQGDPEIEGEALKLDRQLLQQMTAPLEHMLRNAVSHGIESPEEREKLGKPPTGQILLPNLA
ncbi:MAG: hypothetical protein R3E95_15215 [Thiolinea sp.]